MWTPGCLPELFSRLPRAASNSRSTSSRPTLVDVLRAVTYNVNGIRAALRRGFADWLTRQAPDVLALQELRCPAGQLPTEAFRGYWVAIDVGTLAGRNGVAVLSRRRFTNVLGWGDWLLFNPDGSLVAHQEDVGSPTLPRKLRPFADEGRYLQVDIDGNNLCVVSLYVPKGDSPDHPDLRTGLPPTAEQYAAAKARYERKMMFLDGITRHLGQQRRLALRAGRHFLAMGDLNVAHTRADVRNWGPAQRTAGFLPEERAWLDALMSPRTLVDVVRRLHPGEAGPYSWWSWMGQAFDRDTGCSILPPVPA